MTQTIERELTDDLHGGPAARTVRFGWQGAQYEIDLNEENAVELEAAFARFIAAARPVTARRPPTRNRPATGRAAYLRRVREWAREHGYPVFSRGKIPHAIIEAYEQAC
jgi:hypothetical protein